MIEQIAITHIFPRRDARQVDQETVNSLASSIAEIGVINPLRVRPARRMVDGVEADAFEVTTGNHRLKAARKAGLETVPCIVVSDDDLHAELAMIDENLMRAELSPIDKAKSLARRQSIYEELHPDATPGAKRAAGMNAAIGNNVAASGAATFVRATSGAIGQSERTIQKHTAIGRAISDEAAAAIRSTPADNDKFLQKLKNVPEEKQLERVEKELARIAAEKIAKRASRPAVKEWEDVEEEQRRSLLNAWNKASPSVRTWFRDEIVDSPVIDHGAAA